MYSFGLRIDLSLFSPSISLSCFRGPEMSWVGCLKTSILIFAVKLYLTRHYETVKVPIFNLIVIQRTIFLANGLGSGNPGFGNPGIRENAVASFDWSYFHSRHGFFLSFGTSQSRWMNYIWTQSDQNKARAAQPWKKIFTSLARVE